MLINIFLKKLTAGYAGTILHTNLKNMLWKLSEIQKQKYLEMLEIVARELFEQKIKISNANKHFFEKTSDKVYINTERKKILTEQNLLFTKVDNKSIFGSNV